MENEVKQLCRGFRLYSRARGSVAMPANANHLFKLLVLSVHQSFPLLKEFRLRVLDVLQGPLSLDGAIFHRNDLRTHKCNVA